MKSRCTQLLAGSQLYLREVSTPRMTAASFWSVFGSIFPQWVYKAREPSSQRHRPSSTISVRPIHTWSLTFAKLRTDCTRLCLAAVLIWRRRIPASLQDCFAVSQSTCYHDNRRHAISRLRAFFTVSLILTLYPARYNSSPLIASREDFLTAAESEARKLEPAISSESVNVKFFILNSVEKLNFAALLGFSKVYECFSSPIQPFL